MDLIPKPYFAPFLPIVWQLIFIEWLQNEVPHEMQMPLLNEIYGWRSREVFDWLRADKERRDRQTSIAVYGSC